MGDNRTAVLTSLALFAACGGKVATSNGNGGDSTLGTTGTTTGMQATTGMDTTTGMTDPGPGGGAGTSPGFGGNPGPTACGSVQCEPGMVCCNASCGVCVQPGEDCPAIACATPDASADGTGGSEPIDFASFFLRSDFNETLDDSWFISGCAMQQGHDCVTVAVCPNQDPALDFENKGAITNQTFPLGGVLGVTYAVSFKFNGLAEGKFYQGGQWALPDTDVATPGGTPQQYPNEVRVTDDTFYIGGTAIPSNYAVMRMRVLDSNKNEVGRYYMNAYPPNSGAESHRTFLISYSHTIDVPGRGFVEYHLADSNCHMIDNCGPSGLGSCDWPRNIPNEPADLPTFPAMYTDVASPIQPHLVATGLLNSWGACSTCVTGAKQPWHSQLSHLTVTKVVAK